MPNRRCWVPNCTNSRTIAKAQFFGFPRNVKRCREWLKAIGDPELAKCTWENLTRHKFICKDHFLKRHLTANHRAAQNAIPVIFSELRTPLPEADLKEFDASVPAERIPPKSHPSLTDSSEEDNDNELDSIFDSTINDHDYIATTIPRKSYVPVCSKNNQEDRFKQRALDNLRKELCRLCGQKGSPLMAIFGPTSDTSHDMPVSSKIDMYLPIKVKLQDPLPFSICSNCFEVLNHWHELYVTCVAADAVLWKTFDTGSEKTMFSNQDCDVSKCPVSSALGMHLLYHSEVHQTAARRSVEVQTQTEISFAHEIKSLLAVRSKIFPFVFQKSILKNQDFNASREIKKNAARRSAEVQTQTEILSEIKEKDAICEQCGYNKSEDISFSDEFDKRLTTLRVSYKCRFCFEVFKNTVDRKNHMAMCRQLSTICELCGYTVSCRKDLKRHKYNKHNHKKVTYKYLCDKCDRCFMSAGGLNFHIKNIHNTQDRSMKYYCELCCTVFMREIYLHNHKKKHEKGKIKSVFQIEAFRQKESSKGTENFVYSCPVCQEIFSDMLSLVVHLTTKKKIKCSLCQKIMSCEKRFFLHVCGQWTCQYCLKSFDKKVKWIHHERLHTGEKPIKCRKCDLTFRTWQARRHHETHHEPSYQCSYCTKSFRNKCVFQDHVSCHEGKVFSCQVCDKKFSGRRNLGKHINMFHKGKKSVCISE